MPKSAITLCLVPQARQGPFVYHTAIPEALPKIAAHGFDAVEIFPPSAQSLDLPTLKKQLNDHNLKLAALGTGAGWLLQKLTLTDPDPSTRTKALDFVRAIIDAAGQLNAPAIIGSMQGRHADDDRPATLARLTESLQTLAARSAQYNVPLLYEPLNRYETNLFNRQLEAAHFLDANHLPPHVKILADLFHMNIEEQDIPATLTQIAPRLGHIHLADSNRQAATQGHLNLPPIAQALRAINYTGYLSAEVLPLPTPDQAAQSTIKAIRTLFP